MFPDSKNIHSQSILKGYYTAHYCGFFDTQFCPHLSALGKSTILLKNGNNVGNNRCPGCCHTTINPWTRAITLLLYTSSHILDMLWIILGVVLGPIKSKKTVFLAIYPWRKQSDYLRNHAHSYSKRSIAFVLLAHHWLASLYIGALLGVGNRVIHTMQFTN